MVWDPEEEDRLEELEPLHYDVPGHLRKELYSWWRERLSHPRRSHESMTTDVLLNALRVEEQMSFTNALGYFQTQSRDPAFQLRLIRACLKHLPAQGPAKILETILVRGNSGYAVKADGLGLEFRVHPAARDQIEHAVEATSGGVSKHLTRAWNAAYGIEPQPEQAWAAAYNAAEAALRPIISPKDGSAKLGKMIGDYEANPPKWESVIEESRTTFNPDKHTELDARETVIQMARTICYGQRTRHGGDKGDPNTIEESRSAVHLAISIAMLCQEGALRRVEE